MTIEEAIKSIENDIEVCCWATDIVIEELRRLQKENEALRKLADHLEHLISYKYINKDKIREKIEEIKSRMNDDCIALHEFQREAKIDVLYDLLKEE